MGREVGRSSVGGEGRADLPDELWRWTAVELARGIRTRQISSREAVESCLARIEQVNPQLNALIEISPDEALDMANAADRAIANGEDLGALHGVPTSIRSTATRPVMPPPTAWWRSRTTSLKSTART